MYSDGQQPLLDRGRHAALEQHRLADLAERRQQVVVLHVARADLQDVDILQHPFDLRDLHHLGDRGHVVLVAGRAQQLQSFDAHPLKRVRRRARLVRAAAQDARAGSRDAARGLEQLLLVLDRARAGHDHDVVAADLHAARLDDRLLALERAAGEFVRLADAHRLPARRRTLRTRADRSLATSPTTPRTV